MPARQPESRSVSGYLCAHGAARYREQWLGLVIRHSSDVRPREPHHRAMVASTITRRLAITAALIVAIIGTTLIGLSRSDAGPIDGTWRPLFSGTGELPGTDKPFVVFSSDGHWSASDGCNDAGGTFTVTESGGAFRARPVGFRTTIGCINVPNLEVLESSRSVQIQPKRLTFRDTAGSITGSYLRVGTN